MKKIILKTSVKVYEQANQLPGEFEKLLVMAKSALNSAYAPYSQFQVGATLLLKNGEMIPGSNQENAAYTMCLCAERVALAAAASQYPGIAIEAVAVTAKNPKIVIDQPISPCGACRQSLCETENQYNHPMKVILQGEKGQIYLFETAKDLLPFSFDSKFL